MVVAGGNAARAHGSSFSRQLEVKDTGYEGQVGPSTKVSGKGIHFLRLPTPSDAKAGWSDQTVGVKLDQYYPARGVIFPCLHTESCRSFTPQPGISTYSTGRAIYP